MDILRELLNRKYRRYRQRMDFLTRHLRWNAKSPIERVF